MRITKFIFLLILVPSSGHPAEYTAASASRADVNTAVDLASDGDTVLIPNGSATWTSGISTTKQIIIRAENYTPTPAGVDSGKTPRSGATTRNVTITNNSADPLFAFTTGSSYHAGIGGIAFENGTGDGAYIFATGSGSKPVLIFDCYFEYVNRNYPQDHFLDMENSLGGVMWNCVMVGNLGGSGSDLPGDGAWVIKSTRSWESDSTMGTDDTSGLINFYVEDSTFENCGIVPDLDDNARFVARYCDYNGAWAETHGFTSTWGGRHWEFYENRFRQTTAQRNLSGRYFWARAGTGVFTGNQVDEQVDVGYFGDNAQLDIGDNTTPTSNPQDRQPGWGWETSGGHQLDPIYIWSQTGANAYAWGVDGSWASNVESGTEVIVNSGAKPSYTEYTYPHPLRDVIEGSSPDVTAPTVSSATIATNGTTITVTHDESVTAGSGGSGGWSATGSTQGAQTMTYSSGDSGTAIVFTVPVAFYSGETVTLAYTQPTDGWEDASGNDLATLSGQASTNNSTQTVPSIRKGLTNRSGSAMGVFP